MSSACNTFSTSRHGSPANEGYGWRMPIEVLMG
jgi:hypothetical protein